MARERLNDTAAVQAMPSVGGNKSMSINIRQIDNGFIVCKSVFDGKQHSYSETFSEKEPAIENITVPDNAEEQGKDVLRRTADYLNRTHSNLKQV